MPRRIHVSIDICFCKFVHIYVCVCVCFLLLFRNDRVLCLLKIFHIDVKFGKISSHLKLTLFVWDILLLNGLVYVTFNIRLVKCISLKLALSYVQSAWGFRGEMFRTAGLVTCFNYLSKKKKNLFLESKFLFNIDNRLITRNIWK